MRSQRLCLRFRAVALKCGHSPRESHRSWVSSVALPEVVCAFPREPPYGEERYTRRKKKKKCLSECRHSPSEYHKTRVCYVALSEHLTIPKKSPKAYNLPHTTLPVTSYSYGYSYGVASAYHLPAIPMAIPMGLPQPPSYQLFLWPFL